MVEHKKAKGGARPNAGRKKNEVKAAVAAVPIDGRTVGGKEHAAELIEQLNAIDPEMMVDLDHNVGPDPIAIPKDATDEDRKELEKLEANRKVEWAARKIAIKKFRRLSFELQTWARLWFSDRTALDCKKYLHDKAGHQAVRIINHVHDKPLELNVNLSMAEIVREVRERKQAYERNRA